MRYDYRYHTGEIEELVAAVEGIRRQAQETYLITNNRFRRQAVLNALELQHRLRRAPGAGAAHAAHGLSGAGGPDACVGHGNMGDGGLGLTTSTRHEPSVCSRRPTSLARSSSLPNSRGGTCAGGIVCTGRILGPLGGDTFSGWRTRVNRNVASFEVTS